PRLARLADDRVGQRDEGRHGAPGLLMLARLFARLKPSRYTVGRTLAAVIFVSLVAVGAFAQGRFFGGFGGPRVRNFKPYPNTPYDGRFNFVRVVYECDESGYWWRGLPS